jgi:hypothetical protein
MILRGNVIWWEDRSCLIHDISQHAVAPICQHDSTEASTTQTTTTTTATTTTAVQCPPGWREFEGHCYLPKGSIYNSWVAVENDCRIYGAHLTSIHSKAEDDFVKSLIGLSFWIGANYQNNAWRWSDNSTWDYTNWYRYDESSPSSWPYAYYYYYDGWRNTYQDMTLYICKL